MEVGGKWVVTANGYGDSFWSDDNFLKIDRDDGYVSLNILNTIE